MYVAWGNDTDQYADGHAAAAGSPIVLLLDDDRAYRTGLSRYLRSNGFDCLEADSFAAALDFAQAYDGASVIVPELTVGSRHLFDYIAEIRRVPRASVLVLSGHREETEKIVALELGADDFIPKTADRREVLARVRAAARRGLAPRPVALLPGFDTTPGGVAPVGSWQFSQGKRELNDPDGRPVRLTTAEFSLLAAFVENTGRPVSRDHLSRVALGRPTHRGDRGIDNLIAKLRRKLRDLAKLARMIKTARPVGYMFTGFNVTAAETDPAGAGFAGGDSRKERE